jgi:hypothetical protein
MLRPLAEPETRRRGAEIYARLDEIADAPPDDPRVAALAADLADHLPERLAAPHGRAGSGRRLDGGAVRGTARSLPVAVEDPAGAGVLRAARGVLYAIVPVELLVFVLLISGVALPRTLVIAGEAAVLAALLLEFAVAGRLAMAARRNGAGWRAAFRSVEQVLPDPVRRIVAFDTKGLVSLAMFVARRRHGVPAGAVGVAYSRGQLSLQLSFLFAMVVETAAVEMLLRGVKAPEGLRMVVLVVDLYSILIVLAVIAVPDECRRGLHEPVTVVRPLGKRAEARTLRFFADDPKLLVPEKTRKR